MYVYDCNKILMAPTKNRSDKDILSSLTKLTTEFKTWRFNSVFHIMENEASTALKKTMTTMMLRARKTYMLSPR